ncbi:MAG TPA: hydrogenase, partial [Candidatus Omnitrophica bacterium]|nr:hydrogenase [Candidatus Omnitrophota bacterium]
MANMQKTEKQEVIYEESILTGDQTHASVHKKITDIVLARPLEKGWLFALSIALAGLLTLVISIGWLVKKGIGIWGNNNPVGWAFDIINFVWWVG